MSMQDPIADMLTRIRNAQLSSLKKISLPSSKMKESIAEVLKKEGFIEDFHVAKENMKSHLTLYLKYFQGKPVIDTIKRISRPGLRVYAANKEIPQVKGGLGISILSTPEGIMSSIDARQKGVGGEVICQVD